MSVSKRNTNLQVVSDSVHTDKYEALFTYSSDAILLVLGDGTIDSVNLALEDLTGYLRAELVGQSITLLSPDAKKNHLPPRTRALTQDFFKTPGTYEDIALLQKDGMVRWVELSVRLIGGSQTLSIGIIRDVTEKKKLERELITKHAELRNAYIQLEKGNAELQAMQNMLVQAGKMAALGELTAGISHEINQPLQAIRGYTQEVISMLEDPNNLPTVHEYLKDVVSGVDKIASIIDTLRTFTRKSVEKYEPVSISAVIDDAAKMFARQFSSRGISLEKHIPVELPEVYANPVQIEQVIINILSNARDAIEATNRGRGSIKVSAESKDAFIEITIEDDGVGMDDITKAKIFNPFFTTKEVGKGMGLGMSLSYGIITKIHGSIVAESEVGKGSIFIIRIPKDFRDLG